jgi:hypothetical protein
MPLPYRASFTPVSCFHDHVRVGPEALDNQAEMANIKLR